MGHRSPLARAGRPRVRPRQGIDVSDQVAGIPGPIVLATDASVGARHVSIGYVATTGHAGLHAHLCPAHLTRAGARVVVTELRAVYWGLKPVLAAHSGRPVEIRVDNLDALRYLHAWQDGDTRVPQGYANGVRANDSPPSLHQLRRRVHAEPDPRPREGTRRQPVERDCGFAGQTRPARDVRQRGGSWHSPSLGAVGRRWFGGVPERTGGVRQGRPQVKAAPRRPCWAPGAFASVEAVAAAPKKAAGVTARGRAYFFRVPHPDLVQSDRDLHTVGDFELRLPGTQSGRSFVSRCRTADLACCAHLVIRWGGRLRVRRQRSRSRDRPYRGCTVRREPPYAALRKDRTRGGFVAVNPST